MAHGVAFDIPVRFTRETWNGRIKSCRGIGASSLSAEEIAAWEKEHLAYLATLPESFDILHYVTILDLEKTDLAADMSECVFAEKPQEWLPAYFEFENRKGKEQELFRQIVDKVVVDTIYCTVMKDGKPAACASTASEQGYVLLHNVVVDPAQRGQGLGEKLCRAILAKAKEDGARYAYLQVVQGNNVALNLYRKLGFEKVYTYWYMKQVNREQ